MRHISPIFALALLSYDVGACSLGLGYERYSPRPNIKPETSPPRKPDILRAKIRRGKFDETGSSCSSAGAISIQFSGVSPADQTGYKFRLIEGSIHRRNVPEEVVMPRRNGYPPNAVVFFFSDGYKIRKPVTAKIEIIAVSPEGQES